MNFERRCKLRGLKYDHKTDMKVLFYEPTINDLDELYVPVKWGNPFGDHEMGLDENGDEVVIFRGYHIKSPVLFKVTYNVFRQKNSTGNFPIFYITKHTPM